MTLVHFFRIFNRNLNLLLLSSVVMAIVVYLLTKNAPLEYGSSMEIFTGIASGVNIESVGETKVDYNTTSNAYDNLINIIKSKSTLEKVGYHLLYQHMMLDSVNPTIISAENYGHFRYKISQELEDKLLLPGNKDSTVRNIHHWRVHNIMDPKVQLTFESSGSPYSAERIGKIQVKRIQNSDLIEISYQYNEPGITQQTLAILYEVFTERLVEIKGGQTSNVVAYFREKVEETNLQLAEAENTLKRFKIKNDIINYTDQTRFIASQKERLEDEYQKEVAEKESAEAALEKLDRQLDLNRVMIKFGSDILEKRQRLASMKAKIDNLETYYNQPDLIKKLRREASLLEAELTEDVLTRYEYSRTKEGIDKEVLLSEWLQYTLQLDKAKARIGIFEQRQDYFKETYQKFAPLGSEIGRLERAVDIAERNYLEQLDSYNTALLRQRSEKLSSGGTQLTVPPYFPTGPKPSKTTLLILVAAVVGFMIPLAVVILIEFLDSTIRTPLRGEELTGVRILGALPNYRKKASNRQVDFAWLHQKALGLISQNLRLEVRQRQVDLHRPKYVLIFSTRPDDGKLTATHFLANELVSLNRKVLVLAPKAPPKEYDPYYELMQYRNGKEAQNAKKIDDLLPEPKDVRLFDYVFLVLKPIITEPYPLDLLAQFHLAVLVAGAYRDWGRADTFALKEFQKVLPIEPRLVVNGVDADDMNIVLGEIRKSRTLLRKFLKGIVTLQFKTGKARSVKTKKIRPRPTRRTTKK